MSAPEPDHPSLGDLAPDELERLARAHVDGLLNEIRTAEVVVRTEYHPLGIARRHPVATAAVAGAAGLLLARWLRGNSRRAAAGPSAPAPGGGGLLASTVARSLLSGLAESAGRTLPDLLFAWLARASAPR